MTNEQINIKLAPLPYQKRRASTFRWTFLLYFIIAIVFGFSNEYNIMLVVIPCLTILFLLDYSRRLLWVKNAIDSLDTDQSGVKLTYYDKDDLLSSKISWEKLNISKGATFTKSTTKLISIKNGSDKVASFYADVDTGIDNKKIDELYSKLKALKSAYTNIS